MKRLLATLVTLSLVTLLVSAAAADPYLSRYVIASGGGQATVNADISHFGCVGQPTTAVVSYGSTYVHRIGFLHDWMWPPNGNAVGDATAEIPSRFDLKQNYPNPFNPMTTIRFDLPDDRPVRIEVYGIDGRRVTTLVDRALPAGRHEVVWSGRDETGRPVASGTYLYRIAAGENVETRRMTLVK
jgi:hypothetical protein